MYVTPFCFDSKRTSFRSKMRTALRMLASANTRAHNWPSDHNKAVALKARYRAIQIWNGSK